MSNRLLPPLNNSQNVVKNANSQVDFSALQQRQIRINQTTDYMDDKEMAA